MRCGDAFFENRHRLGGCTIAKAGQALIEIAAPNEFLVGANILDAATLHDNYTIG